jgi:hypothetical protein
VNRAYLVFAIDKKTDQICGAGIFSEENPTTMGTIYPFCVLSQPGNDFADARNNLLTTLKDNVFFTWENMIYNKYGARNA